jgi:hypothetical protein
LRLFLAAAALCSSAPAWGAFTNRDSQLPVAALARLDGAAAATDQGPWAAGANPAALGLPDEAWLSLSGGNGGPYADLSGAVDLAVPVQDDLTLGLAWDGLFDFVPPGYAEHTLGLSAALMAAPGLALGVRGQLLQAADQQGAIAQGQGYGVDGGIRWQAWNTRSFNLAVGWWGSQLASSWQDRFWREAVPVTQHLGMTLGRPRWGSLSLAYEDPQVAAAASGVAPVGRIGYQAPALAGWAAGVGAAWCGAWPQGSFSAGLGRPIRWRGMKAELDYAILWVGPQDFRHRIQLQLGWPTFQHAAAVAVPLNVVYEPGTRRVRSATLSLAASEPEKVQDWSLEIRDKDGRLVRVLKGTGTPPALVTWDGKDALGQSVNDADQVSYKLALRTGAGLRASAESFTVDAGISQSGLNLMGTGPDANNLVVPVYDADGRVVQLTLRPPKVPGVTQRWEIQVKNSLSDTLKQMNGEGPFPDQVTWNGEDENGQRVIDQAGLRVRFNAFDPQGRISSMDQAVDGGLQPVQEQESAQARLDLRIPAFREGGPVLDMVLTDGSLQPLSVPSGMPEQMAVPSEIPTASPTVAPTPEPTPQATAPRTASPTQNPTAEPTARPTAEPTAEPTARPTVKPTARPTAEPTARPTPSPTAQPTARPTARPTAQPTAQPQVHAEAPAIAAGLSRPGYLASPDLLPPAFMTREQAEGAQPRQFSRAGISHLPAAVDGILDVFDLNSAQVDEARYADKLQAFYWRLKGYQQRRLLLTGLVKQGETGGEALSRQRVREISRRLVEEGGFKGEFILKVTAQAGPDKGVRIEVLRR